MSGYQQTIKELAPAGYDPAQIEAFMRVEHGTLDHLSRERFADEVLICCMTIDQAGPSLSKAIARSHGPVGRVDTYYVTIIRQRKTDRNADGPRIWNWSGQAISHGEAERMAIAEFNEETGYTTAECSECLSIDRDGYIVSAVCREDEL